MLNYRCLRRTSSRLAPDRSSVFTLACCPLAAALSAAVLTGCSQHVLESGWSDQNRVQVQFYAPPGATVSIKDPCAGDRKHQVAVYGADHRFEHSPEEFAVFNLHPNQSYEFKYTAAQGFDGVSIYGELDIHRPKSKEARKFVAHSFVPIALHSRYHDRGQEHYFPARGPSGLGMDALEVEHLRQGDLITKVYFVADLQAAAETIDDIDLHVEKLRSGETVLNTHLELLDSRFQSYRRDSLYSDPTYDALAQYKDSTGHNRRFIKLEAQRQKLENARYQIREQVEALLNERRIRTRLLDNMRIINRRGSLVLATPENQWEFRDAATQVSTGRRYCGVKTGPKGEFETGDIVIPALGELVCVMRVGGRHMQWDDPRTEMVAFSPK